MSDSDQELQDRPDEQMTFDQEADFKPYSGPPIYKSENFCVPDTSGPGPYGYDPGEHAANVGYGPQSIQPMQCFQADDPDASVKRSQQLAAQSQEAAERREVDERCRADASGPMSDAEFAYCNGYDRTAVRPYDPSRSALDQGAPDTIGPVTPEQERSFEESEKQRQQYENCEKLPEEAVAMCKRNVGGPPAPTIGDNVEPEFDTNTVE